MTSFEFLDHKEKLGLARKQLAALLGLSDSAVGLFERGVQPISPLLAKLMQALVEALEQAGPERIRALARLTPMTGQALVKARTQRALTQAQMAERLGIKAQTYPKLEKRSAPIKQLYTLAIELNISLAPAQLLPETLEARRTAMRFTPDQLARVLGLGEGHIERWETGESAIPRNAEVALEYLWTQFQRAKETGHDESFRALIRPVVLGQRTSRETIMARRNGCSVYRWAELTGYTLARVQQIEADGGQPSVLFDWCTLAAQEARLAQAA